MKAPENLRSEILEVGKQVWVSLHEQCDGSYVGELYETSIVFDGQVFNVEIDCYWDRSKYFDYKATSDNAEYRELVACYM